MAANSSSSIDMPWQKYLRPGCRPCSQKW